MVHRHQRQDEGAQKLGLSRPGGSDEHAVRTAAEFRTLLDVQVHDLAGLELVTVRDLEAVEVLVGEHPPTGRNYFLHALGADQLVPFRRHFFLRARAALLVDDGARD